MISCFFMCSFSLHYHSFEKNQYFCYSVAMRILAIETSCDETGIAILEQTGLNTFTLIGNALSSQIEIHAQYGGVFPALAKRAHAEKMVPMLTQALDEAYLLDVPEIPLHIATEALSFLNEKESQLKESLEPFLTYYQKPDIDYIAVTVGPGLEPALWVGVNTARALAQVWGIPVIPINHMEGHVVTAMISQVESSSSSKVYQVEKPELPILSLLVSGGHTELVLSENFGEYQKIGQTRDDAVGEAFDKVARVLGLLYPGGPAISRLAKEYRDSNKEKLFDLPRPMLHNGDYDFSFSGIKTAVLYATRDITDQNTRELTEEEKGSLACEFENAAIEVLVKKTINAIREHNAQTVVVGGGVAGNTYLREELKKNVEKEFPNTTLLFPEPWLATDNAVMIGLAGMLQIFSGEIKTRNPDELRADGNLSL
jgi:N6-L-threonylcarbamoyladenine synthase